MNREHVPDPETHKNPRLTAMPPLVALLTVTMFMAVSLGASALEPLPPPLPEPPDEEVQDHEVRWSFDTNGSVDNTWYSSWTNVLYVHDRRGALYALDPTDGSERWHAEDVRLERAAAVARDAVILANDTHVRALHVFNGSETWRAETEGYAEPVVAGGVVYASDGARLFAWDMSDGSELWHVDGNRLTTPVAADGVVYVANETALFALERADGSELWRFEASLEATPLVEDGVAYLVAESGLYALDAATGEEIWRRFGFRHAEPLSMIDDVLYLSLRFEVRALGAMNGTQLWKAPVRSGDPAIVRGAAYAVGWDLHVWDAKNGSARWSTSYDFSLIGDPVVAGGFVYVQSGPFRDGSRLLFALDERDGEEAMRLGLTGTIGTLIVHDDMLYVSRGSHMMALETGSSLPPFAPPPEANHTEVSDPYDGAHYGPVIPGPEAVGILLIAVGVLAILRRSGRLGPR